MLKAIEGIFLRKEQARWYNLNQLQAFEAALNRHGFSFRLARHILEFGCGYGRLTHYLFDLAPQARVSGCDISKRDVARCRQRCPQGHFFVNQATPPLSVPEGQFDLIYSYSVFTHLSEENHKRWLRELNRVLRPGGVMLHTVHSPVALKQMTLFSPASLPKYGLPTGGWDGREYHYVPYGPAEPEYGLSVMTPAYVRSVWPNESGLVLLEYAEAAVQAYPEGCQDLVVMVKR